MNLLKISPGDFGPTTYVTGKGTSWIACHCAVAAGRLPCDPPVVLLHGLGAHHAGLLPVAAGWTGTARVRGGPPGFGGSNPLPEHSLTAYADAIEAVLAGLGLSEIVVVGHSLGADVTLVYAVRYPARVRKLAMISQVTSRTGIGASLADASYRVGCFLPPRLARQWFLNAIVVSLLDRMSFSAGTARRPPPHHR